METLFFHGETCEWNSHRFTVAGTFEEGKLNMGIAICSLNDHFAKADGRRIAVERLENLSAGKGVISISMTIPKGAERRTFNLISSMFETRTKQTLLDFFNLSQR